MPVAARHSSRCPPYRIPTSPHAPHSARLAAFVALVVAETRDLGERRVIEASRRIIASLYHPCGQVQKVESH